MDFTVKQAIALTESQLRKLGRVTVSGYLYLTHIATLVEEKDDPYGILLATSENEKSIRERLFDSECGRFAIGGGWLNFAGPTKVTGRLTRYCMPMFPLRMEEIREIEHHGLQAGSWEAEHARTWKAVPAFPKSSDESSAE